MLTYEHLVVAIIHNVGTLAILLLSYGRILRVPVGDFLKQVILGVAFGLAGIFTLLDATQIRPGLLVDLRSVMLILAGPFGGPATAFVTACLTAGARAWLGGAAMWTGIAGIFATALIGVVFARYVYPSVRPAKWSELLALGVLCNMPLTLILLGPIPDAGLILARVAFPMFFFNLAGVMMLGRSLCSERRIFYQGRLYEAQAMSDPLTGLPNRRGMQRRLDVLIEDAVSKRQSVAMLLIDIDNFKALNDAFGRFVGDAAFKAVAITTRSCLHSTDMIARFGGEKIVIALPNLDCEEASKVADHIRGRIQDQVRVGPNGERLTVSIGVAAMRGRKLSFESLFNVADLALYDAKMKGRNRVECATALDTTMSMAPATS